MYSGGINLIQFREIHGWFDNESTQERERERVRGKERKREEERVREREAESQGRLSTGWM